MTAVAGTDRTFWQDGIGLFGAGTPLANDAGIEVLRGLRDYAAVQRALARAGYNGEKVVVFAPTDVQPIHLLSLVGVDQLRRAGMNVDLQEMELVAAAPAAESGDVGRRGLERLLWTYRQIRPEHQPLRQLLDTR
jgi:peptide/nickel transport system substrate-binding protein